MTIRQQTIKLYITDNSLLRISVCAPKLQVVWDLSKKTTLGEVLSLFKETQKQNDN